jgi:AraC-like DNA-binding protein
MARSVPVVEGEAPDTDLMVLLRKPGAAVGAHVVRYCAYSERTGVPTRQREPLSTNVVLIFGLDTTLRVDGQALSAFAGGLDDRCVVIEHDGEMRGIQVDLTPPGARMLFGIAMHELARQSLPLAELMGGDARRLEEQLLAARSWDERFLLVEEDLGRRLEQASAPPADVMWAWQQLRATHGRARVSEIASALGCSRKHIAARFREHVGLPPKLVARTMRFRRAAELLAAGYSLDRLAFVCGYYDQSHLDRDFREFAATTPTEYRRQARPVTFFQDTEGVPA